MKRLQLINSLYWTNQDYDLSVWTNFFSSWIVKWLEVIGQDEPDLSVKVLLWKALIEVTRYWVWETFKILLDLTEYENISITWINWNVWAIILRIKSSQIQDWTLLNSEHSNWFHFEYLKWNSATPLTDWEIETKLWWDFFYRLANIEKQDIITTSEISYTWRSVLFNLMFIQDKTTWTRYNLSMDNWTFELEEQI